MTYPPQQPYQPPVISGLPQSPAGWTPPPTPPPTKARILPWLLGGLAVAVVLVVAGIAALTLWLKPGSDSVVGALTKPSPSLATAYEQCNGGEDGVTLADADKTLIINTRGEDDGSGATMGPLLCTLEHLSTPTAVQEHIKSTRALDGRQTDSWGSFTAAWTYHPDNGVAITIQQR